MTIAFGVNDIGWGAKADAEHKQRYLDGVRGIVEQCRQHKVRVFICSAAITAENPEKASQSFLQQMCDDGLELAKSLGGETIDLQRGMREIQRRVVAANAAEKDPKNRTSLHAADGIHLNDLGQLAMAYVMLKGLGATSEVSSATLDARAMSVISSTGCQVSNLAQSEDRLAFVRLDEGLPLNLGILGGLQFRFIPILEGLNRYMLTIQNLPAGDYTIRAEDRLLVTASAQQLNDGLNISSMTADGWEPGGPWDAQAGSLKELTEARHQLRRLFIIT